MNENLKYETYLNIGEINLILCNTEKNEKFKNLYK